MYIDFLTVMLINLTAGFFMLAHFAWRGMTREAIVAEVSETDVVVTRETIARRDFAQWTPGFALVGFVGVLTGSVMMFTWPLPGSNNIPFGEGSFLFGSIFLATAFAFGRRRSLQSLAFFTAFAGAVAIVLGARILDLSMTKRPAVSAAGFIVAGVVALMAAAGFVWPQARSNVIFRIIFAALALAAGVIWAITAFDGYWGHLDSFSKFTPLLLR
jgi:putative membrane protein